MQQACPPKSSICRVSRHTCLPCRGLSLTQTAGAHLPHSFWMAQRLPHLGRHLGIFQIAEEASVSMQDRSYSVPPLMGNSNAHASADINLLCLPGISEAPPRPWRRVRPSTGDVCCGRGGVCAWIHHARPRAWAEGGKNSTHTCVCLEASWPQQPAFQDFSMFDLSSDPHEIQSMFYGKD